MSLHTDIVYPWVMTGGGPLFDLVYSLRSVQDNWTETFRVSIIGDRPPTLGNGLLHYKHDQLKAAPLVKSKYELQNDSRVRCADVCEKMEIILNSELNDRFVYMYDDQWLLRPMNEEYLMRRVAMHEMHSQVRDVRRDHYKLKWNTFDALREAGLTRIWDYETHMPRLFEKQKMRQVFEKFNPGKNALLFSTLYFNWHYPEHEPEVLSRLDCHKAGFYGLADGKSFPGPDIHGTHAEMRQHYFNACAGKHILNLNDAGRTPALVDVIKLMFQEPSCYETPATADTIRTNRPTDGLLLKV